MPKKVDVTEPCPDCGGTGVLQTPAPIVCTTCDGARVIPVGELEQMRANAEPADAAADE